MPEMILYDRFAEAGRKFPEHNVYVQPYNLATHEFEEPSA